MEWDVSCYNRKGMAHLWAEMPEKPGYVRSHCGQVELKETLQGMKDAISKCSRCSNRAADDNLNVNQRDALTRLRTLGGWCTTCDHHDLKGSTLNSLVKRRLVEKRQRPGWSSVTEYRIITESL